MNVAGGGDRGCSKREGEGSVLSSACVGVVRAKV
jgi:hypothetical protein